MARASHLCLGVVSDGYDTRPGDPEGLRPVAERLLAVLDAHQPLPDDAPPFRFEAAKGSRGFRAPREPSEAFTITGSDHFNHADWADLAYCFAGYVAWYGAVDTAAVRAAMLDTAGFAAYAARNTHRDELALQVDLWANAYAQWLLLRSGDEQLKADWQRRSEIYQEPWGWDDFAPVAHALDESVKRTRLSQAIVVPTRRHRPSPLALGRLAPAAS